MAGRTRLVLLGLAVLALLATAPAARAAEAGGGEVGEDTSDSHNAETKAVEQEAFLFCNSKDVDYGHKVNNPYAYNWCIVPSSSFDVVLFGGLAVVLACMLHGNLAALLVMLGGVALMALAWPFDLGALGNSLAIWLGISPWQLFFYVFLPPLLLDAAVRIDWFMFRKVMLQVMTMAFLVVGAGCALMVPIMLYMLRLRHSGWTWAHACMFGAMVASTDAVAIVAIMRTSGGPKRLRIILEGESLLNDASGLTLFEIFFHEVIRFTQHPELEEPVGQLLGHVIQLVLQMSAIGFVLGFAFGFLTRVMLRIMRRFGAGRDQEVALTLAMAYLAYWVTGTCKGSGVVAVAVMGLYGAAKNKWDISVKAESEGTFDGFWETLAFIINAMVFAYAGAATLNFFIRSGLQLNTDATRHELWRTLWMLPIIYVILMATRMLLTLAFRPLFKAVRGDLNLRECTFLTAAGLRGSASLIMGQAVVTEVAMFRAGPVNQVIKSQIVFWTAGFVLLTLLINAPLLPWVLRITGLSAIPPKQLARRRQAVDLLAQYTASAIEQLRLGEEEGMLTGVDWPHVGRFTNFTHKLASFTQAPPAAPKAQPKGWWGALLAWCSCCRRRRGRGTAESPAPGRGPPSRGPSGVFGRRLSSLARRMGIAPRMRRTSEEPSSAPTSPGNPSSHGPAPWNAPAATWGPGAAGGQPSTIDEHHEEGHHAAAATAAGGEDVEVGRRTPGAGFAAAANDGATAHNGPSLSQASGGPGLLAEVLPALGETAPEQIDVLQQECPLVGKTWLGWGGRPPSGAAEDRSRPGSRGGAGAGASPPPAAPRGALTRAGPTATTAAPPALPAAADGGGEVAGDAYAAALLARSARSRTGALAAGAGAGLQSSPARLPRLRSLATRSATPYFGGSGSGGGAADSRFASGGGAAPVGGAVEMAAPRPPAARGQGLVPSSRAEGGSSGSNLPSLTTSPPGAGALQADPMDRALGRSSRSLASRSFSVAATYGPPGGASDGPPPSTALPAPRSGSPARHRHSRSFGYGTAQGSHSDTDLAATLAAFEAGGPPAMARGDRPPPRGGSAAASLTGEAAGSSRPLPNLAKLSTSAAAQMPSIAPALGRISTGLAAAYASSGVPAQQLRRGDLSARSVPLLQLANAGKRAGGGDSSTGGAGPGISTGGASLGTSSFIGRSSWRSSGMLGKGSLGAVGDGSPDGGEGGANEEALSDVRLWLVSGLKRYFHTKRVQGLLSARGLRILDYGCDTLLDDPEGPLALWDVIERDATSTWVVNAATYGLFAVRRACVWLMHPRLGRVGRALGAPLRLLGSALQRPLNKVLLLGVEVAMEYLMGLTSSPFVEYVQSSEAWSALSPEVTAETAAVWQWLMDREVEAPERYSAVQSYRAAMAVLRQQQRFVEDLFQSGMLDDMERAIMTAPIEAQERALELSGPIWRAPGLKAVLGGLPFMRGQHTVVRDHLVKYGHLSMMSSGADLPKNRCIYVVQSGIIAITYTPLLGEMQDYYLGTGGVYNLYQALTDEVLPGTCVATARGNALGKGPVLFCLTEEGINSVRRLAAAGDERFAQLELDMFRLAGVFILDRLHQQFEVEVSQALTRAAPDFAAQDAAAAASPQQQPQQQPHKSRGSVSSRRAAWVRAKAAAVMDSVQQQLAQAELLQLKPGQAVTQRSAVLLLAGGLTCTPEPPSQQPSAGGAPGPSDQERDAVRWLCSAGRYQGQGLLPVVWETLTPEDLAAAPPHVPKSQPRVTLTASDRGATVLVCPVAGWAAQASATSPAAPGGPRPGPEGPLRLPPRTASSSNLSRLGTANASLDLLAMMPPLAGVTGSAAAPSGTPNRTSFGDTATLGAVGRITEEDARAVLEGGAVAPDAAAAGHPPEAAPEGGVSRRRSLRPLDWRRGLTREKRLPFQGS